ncbi:MAG: hypothetical protein PUD81_02490 [Eggerthellales bacterium]|nr:hypothetical protein [Eggerthellales bacterium]
MTTFPRLAAEQEGSKHGNHLSAVAGSQGNFCQHHMHAVAKEECRYQQQKACHRTRLAHQIRQRHDAAAHTVSGDDAGALPRGKFACRLCHA